MIYAAIAFWLLLGFGVILVALRGGPRGARESLYTQSRFGRPAIWATIVVLVAFGVSVPALVLAFKDRKSTRLNSSHQIISYAVFCLKKKKTNYLNSRSYMNANSA